VNLAAATPIVAGIDELALVDIDDTIKEVHGHQKQGTGFGYSGVRGLSALFAIVSTGQAAPIVVACRLRKGPTNSARGASKFVADTIAAVKRLRNTKATGMLLLLADSAYYVSAVITAAIRAGAMVSITARLNPLVKAAISTIPDTAWTPIKYTNAIFDDAIGQWILRRGGRRDCLHRVRIKEEELTGSRAPCRASRPGTEQNHRCRTRHPL
jgi:hypothetical protein